MGNNLFNFIIKLIVRDIKWNSFNILAKIMKFEPICSRGLSYLLMKLYMLYGCITGGIFVFCFLFWINFNKIIVPHIITIFVFICNNWWSLWAYRIWVIFVSYLLVHWCLITTRGFMLQKLNLQCGVPLFLYQSDRWVKSNTCLIN